MFDVALSRRICCSRVDSVNTNPRFPSTSTVSPQRRPGICRIYFCLVAKSPTYGPPKPSGFPIDCPSATTISAPISPGLLIAPREITSVTTAINNAPFSCAFSAIGVRSRTFPKTSGFCTMTHAVSSSIRAERSSLPSGISECCSILPPNNSRFVRVTAA